MIGSASATDTDLVRYREATGKKNAWWSRVFRRLRSIGYAVFETRTRARAVSKTHGVGRLAQISELANAQFRVGLSGEKFYLHQYYLPERRHLWRRYVDAHTSQWQLMSSRASQWQQIESSRCEDFETLRDKIAFSHRAEMHGIPTISILASFVDQRVEASENTPSTDLFSKPSTAWKGEGAMLWRYEAGIYRSSGDPRAAMQWDALLEYLRKQSRDHALLLQVAARNHLELQPLTNGALATIRIVTCRTPSGSIDIMPPALKMPWGSAVADNLAQGGLVAPIDPTSGQIAGPAFRKDEKLGSVCVAEHPDTGRSIAGFQIPFWREAVELSIAAHAAFDSMFFIGWDIAILDDGPVVLEGNPLWDVDVILLAHRIPVAQTQYVPYWLHHFEATP